MFVDLSDRLALLAMVGDLAVAIEALQVFQIRRAAETPNRKLQDNLYAIDIEDLAVPGWDLGSLFGLAPCTDAWVVIEARPGRFRRFGLRVGRCIAVQRLPRCHAVPTGMFGGRAGAISGAFATAKIPEVKDVPSGVAIDLERLLSAAELEAGARVYSRREVKRDATQ